MGQIITVLLVEDEHLIRAGLGLLLKQMNGIKVAGECGNGRDAIRLVARIRPHVVIGDFALPGLNGIEFAGRLHREYEDIRTIILTGYLEEEYVLQALSVGVSAYLLKSSAEAELELAIRAAIAGHSYLTPVVARFVGKIHNAAGLVRHAIRKKIILN